MTDPLPPRPNEHASDSAGEPSAADRADADAALFGFAGRVRRGGYVRLQVVSALLLVLSVVFVVLSVRIIPVPGGRMGLELAGWAIGGALGAMVASVLIGAGAVTRRARDGALPAIFIGLFYVVNRLLLPVNIGHIGPPTMREVALHFAFIMFVVQILLLVRGTLKPKPRGEGDGVA